MRKWGLGFVVVLLACLPVFFARSSSPSLLRDSDTRKLIQVIRTRHAPLSWFAGDWPLGNHFYRPVVTLTFEMDSALHGDNPGGYGLTNDLLVIGCVLLLFWFVRELTNSVFLASASSVLFALWNYGAWYQQLASLAWVLGFAALCGACLPGRRLLAGISALLTAGYAYYEIGAWQVAAIDQLGPHVIGWLPGRTATVTTLFALIAMAAYARYERVSAPRLPPRGGPLEPPATKGADAAGSAPRVAWLWAVLAGLAAALAFATYEQAVMLPAALVGVAVCLRMQGYKVRWAWQLLFWALLLAYLLARKELLPPGVSDYQKQQFRHGPGVYQALIGYVFPGLGPLLQSSADWGSGLVVLLILPSFWSAIVQFGTNVVGFFMARKRLAFALAGWGLSIIAFLPMAWLHPFEHYNFWPSAMRALFAATLVWVAADCAVTAVSRPALQAPVRPNPAPGSLPHL